MGEKFPTFSFETMPQTVEHFLYLRDYMYFTLFSVWKGKTNTFQQAWLKEN